MICSGSPGIQIAIDFSWLIVFALVFWSLTAGYFPNLHPGYPWYEYVAVGLGATLLFFASVLIHELSHALVANQLGEFVTRISLFIFGGMAHMDSEPASARNELIIAGVGPLTSMLLGVLFWYVPHLLQLYVRWPVWASVFEYLGFINIALAVFNLLPGFPLDGGRVVRAALWAWWGDFVKATTRPSEWGRGIAYGLIGLGALEIFFGSLMGGLWLIFIALFLKNAATVSYQSMVIDQRLSRVQVQQIMAPKPMCLQPELSIKQAAEYFMRYGYGGFPVVEDGRVVGLLSLADIREHSSSDNVVRSVRDLMRFLDPSVVITPKAILADALRQMSQSQVGRLLVLNNDTLAGIVSCSAIARLLMLTRDFDLAPSMVSRSDEKSLESLTAS